jgi:hypothetical protein
MQGLKILLFVTVFLFANCVFAGSRGHIVAFIDISPPPYVDGKANMIALRKLDKLAGKADCWACTTGERRDWGISILYVKKLPDGISYDGVKAAILGDKPAKKTLQKVLANFKDKKDGAMLDGLYAYEHTEKALTIYAISTVNGYKISKISQPVKNSIQLQNLDDLLEKAANLIPFNP